MTLEEAIELNNKSQRKRPSDNEHRIQCACVRLFRYLYPKLVIYAIPNGGQRNSIEAAKLKAEGVLAGVPDLHIPIPNNEYHSLYVEMKNGKKGILSDKQNDMIERLRSYGNKVVVCRSVDDFEKEVKEYLKNYSI
jgi:uncharacterized protein YlzI (FlbEa/FlbD family)